MQAISLGVVPQTCGVSWAGIFRKNDGPFYDYGVDLSKGNLTPRCGCGWLMAGFTNARPEYRKAYEELKARYPIVYQSPVRKNTRTGRKFFFCIFDTKGKV